MILASRESIIMPRAPPSLPIVLRNPKLVRRQSDAKARSKIPKMPPREEQGELVLTKQSKQRLNPLLQLKTKAFPLFPFPRLLTAKSSRPTLFFPAERKLRVRQIPRQPRFSKPTQ